MANALGELFSNIADAIRSKTGNTNTMKPIDFPNEIINIEQGGGVGEGCVTVTFMNGDEVIYTRPVYIGDDCPDPVTQGRITAPTKESTAQYDYTHNGWALANGGTANSNVLKNIQADTVVYSAYTSSTRSYTITYYDEDGTTVLHTEQVEYGVVPSYVPTKAGVAFGEWTPTPTAVTGNASYTASWLSVVASGNCGDSGNNVTWELYPDGKFIISGVGNMVDYASDTNVPWKQYRSQITNIKVNEGVTKIGAYAFYGCTNPSSFVMPESVTHCGSKAFNNCTGLTAVHITNIDDWCSIDFADANGNPLNYAKNLYLNNNLVEHIQVSVTSIKPCVFFNCSNILSVTASNCVSVGDYAFYGCSNLKNVYMDTFNGSNIGKQAFNMCSSLESFDIPKNVTNISQMAFGSCKKLSSVKLPVAVTNIETGAFQVCNALTDVYYSGAETDRANITIGNYNTKLTDATWHYNYSY